ncbi:hypothetical protein KJ830_08365 [bacterium]|nr:hypothetical protein [bacterium]MBU4511044.1 hypothetical protein [bacterium]
MNNSSKIYKIHPVKDLKLRNYAIIGFILVSFAGVVSFLWVPDLSIVTPLLYAIYILVTLYVLRFSKVDIFSPLMFFILLSFLGFGLKLPLLNLFPDMAFFTKAGYYYNFRYNSSAIAWAFVVFLIGYVSFIIGFDMVKRSIKLKVLERSIHPLGLVIFSVFLIVVTFYFRSQYHVGVPGFNVPSIQYAGYIYFPLIYGTLIVISLAFYTALTRNSRFYTIMGLVLFGMQGLSQALLGWKGGIFFSALVILIIYYYMSKYQLRSVNTNIRYSVAAMFLLMVIAMIALYPLIDYYRHTIVRISGPANIRVFRNSIKTINPNVFQTLGSIIMRFSGIENLTAIVAYFQQGMGGNIPTPSFLSNLLNIGILPEQFYTWYVVGLNPDIIATIAPTGWGTLYIYGGVGSVVIGMILIGMASKFLYLTFLSNIRRDGRWIVFYAIFITNIFLPVVFEGTMLIYFKKNFIALLVMYSFFIFILNMTHPRLHIKKASGGITE